MPAQIVLTPANILENARKYSFVPADKASGYVEANETALNADYTGFRHTLVDNTQYVAMMNIDRKPGAAVGQRGKPIP